MMNRERYLQGAIQIGDELLAKAHKNEDGFWWETMTLGDDGKEQWYVSESLYAGVAGIVLFMMELHKHTGDARYLEAVKEGARWLEKYCHDNPTDYYAFYTGRMGVSYLMLLLADYFNDENYKSKALQIAENCEVFLKSGRLVDDLINGSSGTVLGLLHLHAATGQAYLLEKIQLFTDHLIENAQIGEKGIYWDRSPKAISGLCGFSHGASGIGYVFLELAHYFNNDTCYNIADRAFAYENHLYNEKFSNWPDLRKGVYDDKSFEEHKQQYLKGNKEFFHTASDMSAWCHGAPGVGLSRVRAYELRGEKQYLEDLKKALAKTRQISVEPEFTEVPYVLCHGGGGNAILFLEAARVLNEDKYIDEASRVADRALKYRSGYEKYISGYSALLGDRSLFMGDAGIGYFYLLLSDGMPNGASILKPDVTETADTQDFQLRMSAGKLYDAMAQRLYPKTFAHLKKDGFDSESQSLGEDILASVTSDLEQEVKNTGNERLEALWEYEKLIVQLDRKNTSHSYSYIKSIIETEKNRAILDDDDTLLKSAIALPGGHMLTIAPDLQEQQQEDEDNYVILVPTAGQVMEFPLNYFSYAVIGKFERPRVVQEVIDEMLAEFDIATDDEARQVKQATLDQVREAMKQGILQIDQPVEAL